MNMDEEKALNHLGRVKNFAVMKRDAAALKGTHQEELRWSCIAANLEASMDLMEGSAQGEPSNPDRDFMGVLPPPEEKA